MSAALLDDPTAIVGASGAGKSFTARGQVEQLLEARRHTIIFDPTGVWYGLKSSADGTKPGFDVPVFGGPRGDVLIRASDGAALARILLEESVSAILDLSTFAEEDLRRFALDLLTPLRGRERVNLHLVFDEAEEFAPQTAPDDIGFQLTRQMVWIAKRGRVFGLVPTFITQRPADFAKSVLSQVQTLYFHQLIAPADQSPVQAYLKANADKATLTEVMGSLPGLARGERWIYSPRRGLLERGVTAPIDTFDSMATPAPGEARREPRTLAQLDVSKIRAALAQPHEDDRIPADAAAAYAKGSEVGQLLAERDARIANLEQQLADAKLAAHRWSVLAGRIDHQVDRLREPLAAINEIWAEERAQLNVEFQGEPGRAREASGASISADATSGSASSPARRPAGVPSAPPPANGFRGRRALEALASVHPATLTEPQWALSAGLSRKGGTWGTYKGELRKLELVEQIGEHWRATPAGLAAAGVVAEPPPAFGPDLARYWAKRISGTGRMVDTLIKRWPHMTTREALAADLGMAVSGGTFGTYLGRLRGQSLLEEQGKRLRLSPNVMGVAR